MIKCLVFCVVIGSTLKNIECSSKNHSTTRENVALESNESSKFYDKDKAKHDHINERNASIIANSTSLYNSRDFSDSGKVKSLFKDESGITDEKLVTLEIPYPVVTMDAKSHNKTAALIRMVAQANVISNGAKLKPSPSQVNSPEKQEPPRGKILDVLRRMNSVLNSQYLLDNQEGKYERRYVITNFDVIESYIKSRRRENEPSSGENREWPKRRSDQADEAGQSSDETSSQNESDKQTAGNNYGAAKAEEKLDYDERSDDYVVSTKRNVWDYEHEDWADVKTVNWDDVHSSKDTSIEDKTQTVKDEKIKTTIETFNNPTKEKAEDKVAVTEKSDREAKDSVVKLLTTLKTEIGTTKADIQDFSETVKNKPKVLKKQDSQIDEKISNPENNHFRDNEKINNFKLKISKYKKEQSRQSKTKENVDIINEADQYRADRSNKIPDLNKADTWQNNNNKNEELDELEVQEKASKEPYKSPLRRGKINDDEYNDSKFKEKSGLSDRPNQRIYKNSKEVHNDDDDNYKKPAKVKDYGDSIQKKSDKKESLYGDYKDSYDYRDKKKKKQGYNDKKPNDDYKDTKKKSSDYKDYYGGKTEYKKAAKNQDYTDKKFGNDYKNTDNKDYKDSYGQNKKREKNIDFNDDYKNTKDRHISDDYKNPPDKNADYDIDKQDKKKNNDRTSKIKDKWPEERNDNDGDFKNKKSKVDDWDSPNSREKTSAKNDKGLNKNKKEEFDYKDPANKNKKNEPYDKHANNNWDNIGVNKKNNNDRDEIVITTRRTTKKFTDDYDKPVRKPKDYDDLDMTTKFQIDKTTKRFDRHDNNNWDKVGVTRRKHVDLDSYMDRPRGRSKSKNGGDRSSGGFNHVRTPLPMRERKSVYDSD